MREWDPMSNQDPNKELDQSEIDKKSPPQGYNPGKDDDDWYDQITDYDKEHSSNVDQPTDKLRPSSDSSKNYIEQPRNYVPLSPDKEDEPESTDDEKEHNLDDYPNKTDNPMDKGNDSLDVGRIAGGSVAAVGAGAISEIARHQKSVTQPGKVANPFGKQTSNSGQPPTPPRPVAQSKVPLKVGGHVNWAKVALVATLLGGTVIGGAVAYNVIVGPSPNPNPNPGPGPTSTVQKYEGTASIQGQFTYKTGGTETDSFTGTFTFCIERDSGGYFVDCQLGRGIGENQPSVGEATIQLSGEYTDLSAPGCPTASFQTTLNVGASVGYGKGNSASLPVVTLWFGTTPPNPIGWDSYSFNYSGCASINALNGHVAGAFSSFPLNVALSQGASGTSQCGQPNPGGYYPSNCDSGYVTIKITSLNVSG